jgi:DNA-binding transcriptional MerR regulator
MEGNGQSESAIPAKNLFRIGEVSRLTSTKPFVLRFWETEFPMLQPVKSPKGHRLYRRQDIETVLVIKRLLYDEGFTIAGARRHLRDQAGDPSGSNGSTVTVEA